MLTGGTYGGRDCMRVVVGMEIGIVPPLAKGTCTSVVPEALEENTNGVLVLPLGCMTLE